MAYRDSNLRVDTSLSPSYSPVPSSVDDSTISRSSGRERSASTSRGLLPSLRVPSPSVAQPVPHRATIPVGASRARHESRKLLAHVLGQLQRRSMPLSSISSFAERSVRAERGLGAVVRSFAGIAGAGGATETRARKNVLSDDSDDDFGDDSTFHTDATLDLMIQLKDVLAISIAQGWDIFYEDADALKSQGRPTSFDKPRRRRRRSSLVGRGSRSRSRSSSPTREASIAAPELLSKCISILASVIAEDCRYQVSSPSPKKPPNALQSITLDVAQVLIYTHQHEPRIVSRIGFAVLPAFQTFRPSMHIRLLAFFEERVLGGMLENLTKVQGRDALQSPSNDAAYDESHSAKPPMVSILVDEVHDEIQSRSGDWKHWSTSADLVPGLQSTRAPDQPIAVYYLSSLVSPLLAAILEYIDISVNSEPTTQRFHRFFRVLIQRKPDVYLDLLEAVAYHTPIARYAALSVLVTYWPKAVGHISLSKPITALSSDIRDRMERRSSLTRRNPVEDHPYAHQFIPWRFSRPSRPMLFDGFSPHDCRVCNQTIEGFGILCPFCVCAVHFDCYDYPEGSFFTQYSSNSVDVQKVAVHRFCHVLPNTCDGKPSYIRKEQHIFRTVNIFSLSLCFICHQPLWGHVTQGLKCNYCRQFVHGSCLEKVPPSELPRCRAATVNPASMTIAYSALRLSFVEYYKDMVFTEADLDQCSHEELSVFHAILWMQLQILRNGIALGSIVVAREGTDDGHDEDEEIEDFELHYLVNLYETYLVSGKLTASNALLDYLSENELRPQDSHFLFDWNTLAFIASTIKLPPNDREPVPTESMQLLSVGQANDPDDAHTEETAHPYEVVTLAHLRDQLGDTLNIRSDTAARHLLTFLHHIGLLQRLDAQASLFDKTSSPDRLQCSFPLAFGFDVSVDVETLVASIEACLSDIDLTVNELGFLLLTRRFWPNGMLSDYTFRRLTKAILGWILSEDQNLAVILRVYIARGRDLPGVRSGEPQPWPAHTQIRPAATGAPSNGGDYIATRRALLIRYAAPWLLALHDQDILSYATILSDLLTEHAEEQAYWDTALLGELTQEEVVKRQSSVVDRTLRYIVKICQTSIVFTVFDDLFQRWLERTDALEDKRQPLPSLLRLFSRETDSSRHTIMIDTRSTMGDLSSLTNINPLQAMMNIATTTRSGYQRGLRWLCLFASSGVDIPVPIFIQFAMLTKKFKADLKDCSLLVEAALSASWLRSVGRLDLQNMIGLLHVYLSNEILGYLETSENFKEVFSFIRRSLAVCLLLYGCERESLLKLQMIKEEEIDCLPARRKIGSRASTMSDPIIVDTKLMASLGSYVERKSDDLSCLVAKFLNAFANGTPLVESYEVDNFILRNEATLTACTWEFYGIQLPELSMIRPALLVRVLVVDAQPLQRLLAGLLDMASGWEIRMETVLRLFRVILDVTSPAFVVEDRQWGPNVIDIFHYFFSSMWNDDREEIRTAVETWSQTLLPAHLEAIARCWNEALSKAPISERVKLVSFLLLLHSHFPTWKVLIWETIIEALLENDFMQKNGNDEDGAAAAHLSMYGLSSTDQSYVVEVDPELVSLRIGLLCLSMRMVADGAGIDLYSLLRFKDQLVRALGFQDVTIVPSSTGHTFYIGFGETSGIPEYAYPCIADLLLLLDSPRPFDIACSAMGGPNVEDDTPSSLLVGSPFADAVIGIFLHADDLSALPSTTLKNLVKCLLIMLQKHDFDSPPLRHLQQDLRRAVKRSLVELVKNDSISHEIRQLALSISHVFIKRCSGFAGKFIYEAIEEVMGLMLSMDYELRPDDLLVVQAKSFLEAVLSTFAMNGVLIVLFKSSRDQSFFRVLRYVLDFNAKSAAAAASQIPLRDSLLRDTLSRAADSELDSYQTPVENIHQYVDMVHHTRYSPELMQLVGLSLTNIARKTADCVPNTFDASPLLLCCCTLIQHNKSQSRELLLYMETLLRAALVRFVVTPTCLTRVLQVTASLYRKVQPREQAFNSNVFAVAVFEILSDALHAKSRLPSSTLIATVEAIVENSSSLYLPPAKLSGLANDGVNYFHIGSSADPPPQDFAASQAVAKMVLKVAENDSQIIASLTVRQLSLRAWNIIVLASLSMEGSRCASLLLQQFHSFSHAYYVSLMPGPPAAPEYETLDDVEISRAYIAIKLWFLLSRKASEKSGMEFDTTGQLDTQDAEASSARMIWNQLWPPFEMVLQALESDSRATSSLMLASASVADLFLFLHQFRSGIALQSSSHKAVLNRLRTNGRVEAKITRTLRLLAESPPDVTTEFFVNQVMVEMVAEEKLLLVAAKLQDPAKNGADRNRRIAS